MHKPEKVVCFDKKICEELLIKQFNRKNYLHVPCLALPCLALPCLALPCLALPCFAVLLSFAVPVRLVCTSPSICDK
jgi:hypothetical protein